MCIFHIMMFTMITDFWNRWRQLCSDCENHHKISKASRHHGVISIENYHKLPSSISKIGNHCEYHDMKYTHFWISCSNLSKCEFIVIRIFLIWSWIICRFLWISDRFCCRFFVILSVLLLISVKLCSMLSINVDVLDVLIIFRIDNSPTQYNFLRIQRP
jgi:hypothetical protein